MNGVGFTFQDRRREFFLQNAKSFVPGACLGWFLTGSPQGTTASGCFSLIFTPRIDFTKQIAIATAYASVSHFSKNLLNVNLSIITPLMISFFSKEAAKWAAVNSVVAIFFTPEINDFLRTPMIEVLTSTSFQQLYLKPFATSIANSLDKLFQYRLAQGLGFLWSSVGLTVFSKFFAKTLLQLNIARRGQLFMMSRPVGKFAAICISSFCAPFAFAEVLNYLSGKQFGEAKWLIPVSIITHAVMIKYKLFLLDEKRTGPIFPKDHLVEIRRDLQLVMSDNELEDAKIELSTLKEIQQVIQNILSQYEKEQPSSDEIKQLETYITQFKNKMKTKLDSSLDQFLKSAESRLKNIKKNQKPDFLIVS